MTANAVHDRAITGGGIHESGIARDVAGRGWSGLIYGQADLGDATSSAFVMLIHGGLRCLEHHEFRLVRT